MPDTYKTAIVVFPGFESLDAFGPVEMFGMYPETFALSFAAEKPGEVTTAQGPRCGVDVTFAEAPQFDILLVPGGQGTRREVDNGVLHDWLRQQDAGAQYMTTVCTGSAVLARTGLLDGKNATGNKKHFDWVASFGPKVDWVRHARWVEDGKYLTSSGVSAGMDMTLALIAQILDRDAAEMAAKWAEYDWHDDASHDPFADIWK